MRRDKNIKNRNTSTPILQSTPPLTPADFEAALSERMMCGMDVCDFGRMIRSNRWWGEAMDLAAAGGRTGAAAQLAFRAAWSLEAAYFASCVEFARYTTRFLEDFTLIRNPSVHRHYTKMLADMMARGAVILSHQQAGRIGEFCFDLLIDTKTKVAVKVWAMEILAMLTRQVEWIDENLRETIESQMYGATPAFIHRARRVIKRLAR